MPKLNPAQRARLAHQILRLKENGIHDLDAVRPLVAATDLAYVPPKGAPQSLGGSGHPLERVAVYVARAVDAELPGPTDDEQYVEHLFKQSLRDIYVEWKDQSKDNLQRRHPDDFELARESWKRDEEARREKDATMSARGAWPSREAGLRHGAADWAMANAMYDLGREAFAGGDTSWDGGDIRVILIDSADYTVNLAAHQFLSSVPGAARVAVSGSLASKTITAGVLDAADITMSAVTGDQSEALVIYDHTGAADTDRRLLAYIDTATNLPITPNGGDIATAWDNGSNRIFKL